MITGDKMKGMVVVFTGFRDNHLEECVTNNGGKMGASVSNKITHLVCKAIEANNSKQKRAKELGKTIVTREDFTRTYC